MTKASLHYVDLQLLDARRHRREATRYCLGCVLVILAVVGLFGAVR